MILQFGKHKGKDLVDVPIDYLKWLEEQDWIDKYIGLRPALQHEIERRTGDRPGLGFEVPKTTINFKV